MPNPIITIHNAESGEVIEREMNAEELAVYQRDLENSVKRQAEAEAKAQAKAAAEAKLAALGLTADDMKALGLQNNPLRLCRSLQRIVLKRQG